MAFISNRCKKTFSKFLFEVRGASRPNPRCIQSHTKIRTMQVEALLAAVSRGDVGEQAEEKCIETEQKARLGLNKQQAA